MVTYGNIASIQSQSSMAIGQSQANSLGLGQTEANALGVTNLMGGQDEDDGGLVTKTLEIMNKKEKGRFAAHEPEGPGVRAQCGAWPQQGRHHGHPGLAPAKTFVNRAPAV